MGFVLENAAQVMAAKTTDNVESALSTSTFESDDSTIKSDYDLGIVNFRFLAKKHNVTIEEVNKIINNK